MSPTACEKMRGNLRAQLPLRARRQYMLTTTHKLFFQEPRNKRALAKQKKTEERQDDTACRLPLFPLRSGALLLLIRFRMFIHTLKGA